MHAPLLNTIVIVFALAIGVLLLCYRLRIPMIIGFLATGIVAGPQGLSLIGQTDNINALADIGVVLLLFTVGIEFSFQSLLRVKREVFVGGALQSICTALIVAALAAGFGLPVRAAVFVGALAALSSTAVVLKIIQEKNQLESPHGRITLAILIFQDLLVIPLMLLLPLLATAAIPVGGHGEALSALLKNMGIFAAVMVALYFVLPRLLYQVTKTRSQELFLLFTVVSCFALAWLTGRLGLSPALGAFAAGLLIAESDYAVQARSIISPFRDLFVCLFFISIGLLCDLSVLYDYWLAVTGIVLAILIIKAVVAAGVTAVLGFPVRTMVFVGVALCQIGEFSLVLARHGLSLSIIDDLTYRILMLSIVISMALTPFLLQQVPKLAKTAGRIRWLARINMNRSNAEAMAIDEHAERLRDHVVIIGYGMTGRNLAQAAQTTKIPYTIIEMNPQTVKVESKKGVPIHFGDATQRPVLEHAAVDRARLAIIVISDPPAIKAIVSAIRRINPSIHIIARVRFLSESASIINHGANEVIAEDFETSVELFIRMLHKYLIPRDAITKIMAHIRADGYEMFRPATADHATAGDVASNLPDSDIVSLQLCATSPLVGKTLAESALRLRYGVTVLAVRRRGEIIDNPSAHTLLNENDIIIVLGKTEAIRAIHQQCLSPSNSCKGAVT